MIATYQDIRGIIEQRLADALLAAGLPAGRVIYDNVQETPPPVPSAMIAVSFTRSILDAIGCQGGESIAGTAQINLYLPKGTGSRAGESYGLALIDELSSWNGALRLPDAVTVRSIGIDGPRWIAADDRPYRVMVVAAGFSAAVP